MKSKKTLYQKINALNFNKKIAVFLVSAISITALMLLAISMFSTGKTLREKSASLVMQQLETVANNLETTLNDFSDIATAVISDNRIQNYLRDNTRDKNETQLVSEAYQTIYYINSTNSYVEYLSVYSEDRDQIIYRGTPWTIPNFAEEMKKGYERSLSTPDASVRVNMERNIFYPEQYSLNFYQPIYDIFDLTKQRGILTMSLNHETLRNIYASGDSNTPFDIYLCNKDGSIVSSEDTSLIGTASPHIQQISDNKGTFEDNGDLVVYSKIPIWDWYVVGTIPTSYLMQDTYQTSVFQFLLVVMFCLIFMFCSFAISNSLYKPLEELSDNMTEVTSGNLLSRMSENYPGEDISKIASGFNEMLDNIGQLMTQVKEEQHQVEQIKLNALQSQIKPHFLYNTLECIHWQAAAGGNKEVSTMIKALATYYRLCLSKGQDIIPLSQEIAHIKSYLLIQNMRYDNIIESSFEVDSCFDEILIPKMTLQPLIENSIYHGIKIKQGQTGRVMVRVYERYDMIIVTVADSGTGMSQERIDEMNKSISLYDDSFGYGVRNVNKRIELIFGQEYGLHFLRNGEGGVTVEIRLPKEFHGNLEELMG